MCSKRRLCFFCGYALGCVVDVQQNQHSQKQEDDALPGLLQNQTPACMRSPDEVLLTMKTLLQVLLAHATNAPAHAGSCCRASPQFAPTTATQAVNETRMSPPELLAPGINMEATAAAGKHCQLTAANTGNQKQV
jgi:hypothetical protein